MKSVIVTAIALICCFAFEGQSQDPKPEKVVSIIKIQYEYQWYVDQHEAWKKELAAKPNNPDGWLSYYTATRMAKILSPDPTKREEWVEKMNQVVEEMKKKIEGTYEYHYIQGYNELEHLKGMEHIMAAYKMDPSRSDVYDELLTHYERARDMDQLEKVAKMWRASGEISPTLLLWNYNMLMSTEKDAILFTFGDNDTYPALVLQHSDNIRKDVTVINTSLMLTETYRNKLFKALKIPALKGDKLQAREIVEHVLKNCGHRPVYTGIAGNHYHLGINDQLYNVGLAMRYSKEEMNTISYLVKNFENNILLDHLTLSAYVERFPSDVNRYSILYIPGLISLYKHYALIGDLGKKKSTKDLILRISKGSDQEETIREHLEKL